MIGKIFKKSPGSFKTRIRYIFGCTKHDHEISQITFISSNCMSKNPLPGVLSGDETDMKAMIDEFDFVEKARSQSIDDSTKKIKPVFHAMLSLKPGETLSKKQWQQAIDMYLEDLGFDDTCKYVAVMHRDKDHEHVHIVANRIRFDEDFKLVRDSEERTKTVDSVDRIEDALGLSKSPKPSETWGITVTHAEIEACTKDNSIPFKHRMIARIAGAIEATRAIDGDMFDLVKALRKQKVYLHLKVDTVGQPVGISYEFDGKIISGRQLKRARLTFQKLTTQEGIHYDKNTISELQNEISKRDPEDEARIFLYRFKLRGRNQYQHIRFTAQEKELREFLNAIMLILTLIFGGTWEPFETKCKRYYTEYIPGIPMDFKDGIDLRS